MKTVHYFFLIIVLVFVSIFQTGCAQDNIVKTEPVADIEAASTAFQLYYKERVDRAVVSYNRYSLFGGVAFATTIGKAGIAKDGDNYEIVPGPNDNNMVGYNIFHTWQAYKVFRSRLLELSLIRMLNGLAFQESVSGHPGLTNRHAYPGWRITIDTASNSIARIRDGKTVTAPQPFIFDSALESEIMATFFADGVFTYRNDPSDFMFDYMPAVEVGPYAVTYAFSMLPKYIRVSDCCATLMRTPAGYPWEGAFWSNHNSRDNLPDYGTGYMTAFALLADDSIPDDLREAATRAWSAANRVGDSIQQYEGKQMTVDEHHSYDTLVVAGEVRPDGETEAEDLGSLSDCQMVYLARAFSSEGLSLPLPELPLPGSIEKLVVGVFDECELPETVHHCKGLGEAFCGADWGNIEELHFFGNKWLELAWEVEQDSPGGAEKLIGSFQDDYYEKVLAIIALITYAETVGDELLLAELRSVLQEMTDLMRRFADIIYMQTKPDRWVRRRYEAALFDGYGGIPIIKEDLNDFGRARYHANWLESTLALEDTQPAPLLTDEEIKAQAESRWDGRSDTVKQRYRDAFGDVPPLRRSGDGYEARTFENGAVTDWKPVSRPHHHIAGGFKLLEAIALCNTTPSVLDCTWAILGCQRPDLNGDGTVDEADTTQFETLQSQFGTKTCTEKNQWCDGADLDMTGTIDDTDTAFMEAAQGCWY